jgi:hypothetical protein
MYRLNVFFAVAVALGLLLAGCDSSGSMNEPDGPPVVEVTASDHTSLDISASEIPSGWTTFRFANETHAPHFVVLEKMPVVDGEQKTVEDSKAKVVPVFQNIMDDINGKDPSFPDAGFELPEWYSDVVFVGGPGLTSPETTSRTTVNLEPGTYVVECYVKTEDGVFHSTEDMIEGLTVTGSTNGAQPPQSSLQLAISSDSGISLNGEIDESGQHTIAVDFEDQTAYSHFLGHDVHLVRLSENADMEGLRAWMNWATPGGLAEPAPSGIEFIGGAQDMPGGSTTYVSANLESGDYAWIAEVPKPTEKGMLKTFTVE